MVQTEELELIPHAPATVNFQVWDVTGTQFLDADDIQSALPASEVAASLAVKMQLPSNIPWGLRDDSSSLFLDDLRPIGEQVRPGSRLTVTPKTHLG